MHSKFWAPVSLRVLAREPGAGHAVHGAGGGVSRSSRVRSESDLCKRSRATLIPVSVTHNRISLRHIRQHLSPGCRAVASSCRGSVSVERSPSCVNAGGCVNALASVRERECVRLRERWVRIRGQVRLRERWVCLRSGCVYTPPGAYTRVGAYTRAVGACTQRVRIHTRVRIRGQVRLREWWVCIRSGCIYAPGCVYAGRCVYASGRCVHTGGVYTHPLAYTQVSAYTHPRLRLRRNRRTVMHI